MSKTNEWSARCRDWLLGAHLPLWADRGVDWNAWGGHERLDADTLLPVDPGQRRSMVCARQVYLWSAAYRSFRKAEHLALAERAYTALTQYFQDPAQGGWVFSVTKDGKPLDGRKDFYAHAFVLFALAHYAAIGRNADEALRLARTTWTLMQEKLALPQGWFAPEATPDWRLETRALVQNPHMHLLEALLALAERDPEQGYQASARTLIELFRTRLYCGVLGEFFDSDGVASGPEGQILEPGHHFEWAWLLRSAARILTDPSLIPLANALTLWAGSIGTDPTRGGAYDQIGRDGVLLRSGKRLWPQAEAVKAYAVAYAATPSKASQAPLLRRLAFLFDHYLLPDGRWREHLDADLMPILPYLPASTPYHIFFALTEAIQALEGEARRLPPGQVNSKAALGPT